MNRLAPEANFYELERKISQTKESWPPIGIMDTYYLLNYTYYFIDLVTASVDIEHEVFSYFCYIVCTWLFTSWVS